MRAQARISVIIPALNEAKSIANVLAAIPEWVDEVIVADNGSSDGTDNVAQANGARVVHEPRRGYGSACLKGISALDRPDIVVFLDADYSDHPEQMDTLVDPILQDDADIVIGSRVRGVAERGALTPQARFGNRLACFLIRLFWGVSYTDLGPFRAIRHSALMKLNMADPDYGWTVEMQIKAALQGLRAAEVPADYRKRVGRSKISGTVRGVIGAGYKILSTIFLSAARYYWSGDRDGSTATRIIVFTRYPEPGKTKTRLIPALGAEGAADLQRSMTERAVATANKVEGASIEVRFAGGDQEKMQAWLGPGPRFRPQADTDLGGRMADAFRTAFLEGARRTVIVGVDSPDINPGILRAALDGLTRNDLVLGPATDGGYYLIGIRRKAAEKAVPALFEGIDWGTASVLQKTRDRALRQRLKLRELAPLDDIDRPEDLDVWERALGQAGHSDQNPAISIIIPTLNEADCLRETLSAIPAGTTSEVIVVDGASHDDTRTIAESYGAKVFTTHSGRAAQINFGSAKARADILLFLHADTLLPAGFESLVIDALSAPGVVAGAFEFGTDENTTTMRIIARAANLRSRWLKLPYGDQGLFIRKDRFRELGGYASMPIMEDYELVRRLARQGKIVVVPAKVTTSARRWRRLGPWRVTLMNQAVVLLYSLGASPAWLARLYGRRPGP